LHDRFDAFLGDRLLVAASRIPFFDACRALLELGADPGQLAIMRHAGSAADSLRGRIGVAGKLTVAERDRGEIHFERWKPFSPSAVEAPIAPTEPDDLRDLPVVEIAHAVTSGTMAEVSK
jgi:hypothetical protein